MKIDNDTDEDIDYNQTGGGPADEDEIPGGPQMASGSGPVTGSLPPESEVVFTPEGIAEYSVQLTDGTNCCLVSTSDAGATIIITALAGCNITVSTGSVGSC
jgi:hypothetical protein